MKSVKHQHSVKDRNTGSSVIEVLIATLVVGTVLTALAFLMSMNVKNNAEAELRKQASVFAQAGVDVVRNNRSALTWAAFSTTTPTPLGLAECDKDQEFAKITLTRSCTWSEIDTNRLVLKVEVTWPDSAGSVTTEQIFYNR